MENNDLTNDLLLRILKLPEDKKDFVLTYLRSLEEELQEQPSDYQTISKLVQ